MSRASVKACNRQFSGSIDPTTSCKSTTRIDCRRSLSNTPRLKYPWLGRSVSRKVAAAVSRREPRVFWTAKTAAFKQPTSLSSSSLKISTVKIARRFFRISGACSCSIIELKFRVNTETTSSCKERASKMIPDWYFTCKMRQMWVTRAAPKSISTGTEPTNTEWNVPNQVTWHRAQFWNRSQPNSMIMELRQFNLRSTAL